MDYKEEWDFVQNTLQNAWTRNIGAIWLKIRLHIMGD